MQRRSQPHPPLLFPAAHKAPEETHTTNLSQNHPDQAEQSHAEPSLNMQSPTKPSLAELSLKTYPEAYPLARRG